MRAISRTVYLVPRKSAGTDLAASIGMLKSQRGKAASEWCSWILAYEHTLRAKYNDVFVNRLDLDLHELRLRCERGDNPVDLANNDVIPLMTNRARVRVALERQRILDDLARMRSDRHSKTILRTCIALAAFLAIGFGYLTYRNWTDAAAIRAGDQAHLQWRQDIGLK